MANINPSNTNDVVGVYARATPRPRRTAIAAAKAAFPAWSRSGPLERQRSCRRRPTRSSRARTSSASCLSREEGKTLRGGHRRNGARRRRSSSSSPARRCGWPARRVPSVRPGVGVEMTREPIGVVGIITPWNFPIAIPAWKIAPALCYGNTVVFKPADLVPGCSWAIVDILHRAGLPKGVLNLVMGKGSVVGQAMLDSKDVNAITFTGSVGTGKRVAEAERRADAQVPARDGRQEPDRRARRRRPRGSRSRPRRNGAFFSTGQRCTASSRLIVTEGIHDKFVAALTERCSSLVVGDALKAGHRDRAGGRPEPAQAGHRLHRDRQGGGRQAGRRRRAG